MKIIILLLVTFAFCHQSYGQISDDENKALDKFIATQTNIEADVIKSSILDKLFDATFFDVKKIPLYSNDGSFSEMVLMKSRLGIHDVENTEILVPLIKDEIILTDETVAKQFQKAFTLLFKHDPVKNPEIIKKENQWIFVQSDWFGEKSGFIVNTDTEGNVKEIFKSGELEL